MTLEDKVHGFLLHPLRRAEELRNVSAACRELGISRTVFDRWKKHLRSYGTECIDPKRTSARPGRPPLLGPVEQRAIVATALACPRGDRIGRRFSLHDQGSRSPRARWGALRRRGRRGS